MTAAAESRLPPGPHGALLAGEELLAWVRVDLTRAGTFGEEVLAASRRELVRIAPDGTGAVAIVERAPLEPPELIERRGHLVLARASGEELVRATLAELAPLTAFRDAVARFLESGEVPAASSLAAPPCARCGGATVEGRCAACRRPHRTLARLAGELRAFARPLGAVGALVALGTLLNLAPPWLTKTLVDEVLRPGVSAGSLARVVALMAVVMLVTHLVGYARRVLESRLKGEMGHALRVRAFEAAARFSLVEVSRATPSGLAQVVMSDSAEVVNLLLARVLTGAFHALMVAGVLAALLWISPWLAVLVLAPAPLVMLAVRLLARRGQLLVTRGWTEQMMLSHRAHGFANGFRVVKAFGAEADVTRGFSAQSGSTRDWEHRIEVHYGHFGPVLSLITGAGSLLIWGYGGWLVLKGHVGVGSLVAYIAYLSMLYAHVQSLFHVVQALPKSWTSCDHYLEMLDTVPAVREPVRAVPLAHIAGGIRLERVCFSYVPGRQVLHDVDLTIAPGEFVGLVGRSGSGKTTLVNLIARFYDPTRGRVTLDGVPLPELSLSALRRRIGVVLQTPFLFDGTVLENLRLGRPDATFRAVCEAAERARAHELILDLPDGYDTLLSERVNLSAGERQRLTIARALLADPAVLILDEATASLDARTELEVQEATRELTRGRTTIAIAHRLATLARADRLVVLDAGRVVDSGPHDELAARPGVYRDLVEAQAEMARAGRVRGEERRP